MENNPQTNCKRCGLIVHTNLGGFGNPTGTGWICDTCHEAAVSSGEIQFEEMTEEERRESDEQIDRALNLLIFGR